MKRLIGLMLFAFVSTAVFGASETAILNFANNNTTTTQILINTVKLTSTQANNVVSKRPFASVVKLTSVIGSTAVGKISAYVDKTTAKNVEYIYNSKGKLVAVIVYRK